VVLEGGEDAHAASRSFERRYGTEVRHVDDSALDGYATSMTARQAAAAARQKGVDGVEPDQTVTAVELAPNGILRTDSWNAHQDGHDGRTLERTSVRVVVLDTGVNAAHADLAPNLSTADGVDCIDPGTPPDDDQGHGTHVMGTVGASFDGTGVVGVATDVGSWPGRS
jgi:subtilisin